MKYIGKTAGNRQTLGNYYTFGSIYRDINKEYPQEKSACLNICSVCESGQEHKCELRTEVICRYKPTDYITHEQAERLEKKIRWLAYELKQQNKHSTPVKQEATQPAQIKSINL